MPKTFSDAERAYIRGRLMDEAEDCLARFGIRRTTVDELVRRANIPKGTFYLFYETKELLFFDVLCRLHDRIHEELLREIDAMDLPGVQSVTDLIVGLYKRLEGTFLFRFATDGEFELFMRKLPAGTVQAHTEKDDLSVRRFLSLIPGLPQRDADMYSAALRAVFLTMPHRREIGEEQYDDALRVMIRGIVMQMFEGGLSL